MGMALTGALLASASVAKANAYLDVISGASSTSMSVATGQDISYTGSIGSYTVDVSSGTETAGFDITLTESAGDGTTLETAGLEIIYSSGIYTTFGPWVEGLSSSGGDTLSSAGSFYTSPVLYTGGPALTGLTQLGPTLTGPAAPFLSTATGSLTGSYDLTEVMTFGNPAAGSLGTPGQPEHASLTQSYSVVVGTAAPDGGMTLAMMGFVTMGLAGLRSKFGAKRS